jgi:hypothetical protein
MVKEMTAIRYAMIKDGIVQNISLWDGDTTRWQPPEDMLVIPAPDHIGMGWSYDGENWSEPVPAPPEE